MKKIISVLMVMLLLPIFGGCSGFTFSITREKNIGTVQLRAALSQMTDLSTVREIEDSDGISQYLGDLEITDADYSQRTVFIFECNDIILVGFLFNKNATARAFKEDLDLHMSSANLSGLSIGTAQYYNLVVFGDNDAVRSLLIVVTA